MIDTLSLALGGIGFPTFNIATNGFSFEIVPPPPPSIDTGGSGTGSGNIAHAYTYIPYYIKGKILVKVTYGGHEWNEEYEEIENNMFLDSSEAVLASFIGITQPRANVSFIRSLINTQNAIIKVRKL